jgi:glycosyltransferase involved in cell wall biosynthesis
MRNNTVYFLTSSGGKKAVEALFPKDSLWEIRTNVSKIKTDRGYLFRQLWSYILILLKSISKVRTLPQADLVYLDSDGLWDIFPALFYKRKHPEVVLVSMNHVMIEVGGGSLKARIYSLVNYILQSIGYICINKWMDVIFVNDTDEGYKIQDRLTKKNPHKKYYHVQNGVDSTSIKEIPTPPKEYDACFLGYLRPSKGLYDIVPIWRDVCREKPDAQLIIIGGLLLEYRKYLYNEIKASGLTENIILLDSIVDKLEVYKLLKQSRIFISASHKEGWSMAMMECLSCGLPGVVWDLPVYKKSLRDGVIMVERFNIPEFSRQVVSLLRDNALRENLQKKALNFAEQHDWDIIARKESRIFEEILSGVAPSS